MYYELGETIFFTRYGRARSAPVLARMVVDVELADGRTSPFGQPGVSYYTCHGIVRDGEAYHSEEALADNAALADGAVIDV